MVLVCHLKDVSTLDIAVPSVALEDLLHACTVHHGLRSVHTCWGQVQTRVDQLVLQVIVDPHIVRCFGFVHQQGVLFIDFLRCSSGLGLGPWALKHERFSGFTPLRRGLSHWSIDPWRLLLCLNLTAEPEVMAFSRAAHRALLKISQHF